MIEIIPNLHPAAVHFPIALALTSTICYFVAMFIEMPYQNELLVVSKWCIWFASLTALVSVGLGIYAYNTVPHDSISHQAMSTHMYWALITTACILASGIYATKTRKSYGKEKKAITGCLLMTSSILISITGWLGAETVYRYGIGVKRIVNMEQRHEHTTMPDPHEHNHH